MQAVANSNELKLRTIMKNAPLGLIEINQAGTILEANLYGEAWLKVIRSAFHIKDDNLFILLEQIGFTSLNKIRNFPQAEGLILLNELVSLSLPNDLQATQKYYTFTVTKFDHDCIMFSLEDITQRHLEDKKRQDAELGKAIAQSKLEIASGVLHDIGNAVVGFGSYLTRIRRSVDQNSLDNLTNLTLFIERQQASMATAMGSDKAAAVVTMLKGIAQTQKDSQHELRKYITEQLNIITHIQEILAIQRQYVAGNDTQERKPVNLRSVLNDCMAMLFASIDKRGIAVSLDLPDEMPILKGDRTKLMQVFLNLLKNSIEAIDITASNKLITVRIEIQSPWMIVTIRDTGNGFNEETGQALFTREFTTKTSGSGLGLYNCKTIIESHSGSIQLTSPGLGQGALATVQLVTEN
ncbi:GHKL domain-containing protein [Spirosoma sp. HMF4905]|uniref:histidine kinase n=1 Tax=Spirosoma arboris TaxID=2682092 RepID=A0A7K1S807_9BACT|nr:HAMP domain-containing sensor histidine kinase [Spirosoma arboris]MVM29716.1 GHKL domain-containing protein [Spirosoma arboris]